ncbi:hypothetical protein MPL3365_90042 [Mesorhizobium plurifarium]|uniref:Uncharacterized protein n=1 Tax=Mesorhizobium plurifarium TaxID=69974 RepID=A0A090GI28_MESPL|nr:hypothetical protein MPL3365_90042 [Mesorhizobium plurifarium]
MEIWQSPRSALPLIALPGISPRMRGERSWPQRGALPATLAIGETAGDIVLLPVLRGEDGGSQMRGGAALEGKSWMRKICEKAGSPLK